MEKTKFFLLHFAGGNCYSYQFLQPKISEYFEPYMLELPGRGKRMREPFVSSKEEAVQDLLTQVLRQLNEDDTFLIYGHSLGATLAWMLTLELEKRGFHPEGLIVSGNPGPNIGENKGLAKMLRQDLIAELKQMGGISDEVINNDDLFNFFEPIMRADFALSESRYNMPKNQKIDTPLYAIMGSEEDDVEHIKNWRNYSNSCTELVMEGDHFFIYKQKNELIDLFLECDAQITVL